MERTFLERFSDQKEEISDDEDLLRDAAEDSGIDTKLIPKKDAKAYQRLLDACRDYSNEVHREMSEPPTGEDLKLSQSYRRTLHNNLCIMIFGTKYAETKPNDIKKISNFAHLVCGNLSYVERR